VHDAHPPVSAARDAVARALAEDLTPIGDLTSLLLPPELVATARFVTRRDGVLAGRLCADEAFRQVDDALVIEWSADDGDRLAAGDEVGRVTGPLAPILTAERTALNFLGHLSGIATLTARYVEAVAGTGAQVLDTRKTTPGLRELEKAAVAAGGGRNHRMGLHDAILIKENHIALAGGVAKAVHAARGAHPELAVEVECRDLEEVAYGIGVGADLLLLDNMDTETLRKAVALREQSGGAKPPSLEASGGVSLETVREIAETGVDLISVGALTHSAPTLDFSLLLEPA